MKEILILKFIKDLFLRSHEWGWKPVPEQYIPWIQSFFVFMIFSLIIAFGWYFWKLKKDNHQDRKPDEASERDNPIPPNDIDNLSDFLLAIESINQWAESYGILRANLQVTYRENLENFLVRFYIPGVELSNEQIDSFQGTKLKNFAFERLFFAKVCLGASRGALNVYRSVPGGTCIDALVRTDRKIEKIKADIKRLEAKLGHCNQTDLPPDFLDKAIASSIISVRLLQNYFKRFLLLIRRPGPVLSTRSLETPTATVPSKRT